MRDYIEFRVYIKDDVDAELLVKAAEELHDTLHDTIGDNCIAFMGDFVDLSTVFESGDVTYEIHFGDKK